MMLRAYLSILLALALFLPAFAEPVPPAGFSALYDGGHTTVITWQQLSSADTFLLMRCRGTCLLLHKGQGAPYQTIRVVDGDGQAQAGYALREYTERGASLLASYGPVEARRVWVVWLPGVRYG